MWHKTMKLSHHRRRMCDESCHKQSDRIHTNKNLRKNNTTNNNKGSTWVKNKNKNITIINPPSARKKGQTLQNTKQLETNEFTTIIV